MTDTDTMVSTFQKLVQEIPNEAAIIAPDMELTYEKLWRVAQSFAGRMSELGIDRNSTVALDTVDANVAVSVMFATAFLGARFTATTAALKNNPSVVVTHYLRSPEVDSSDEQNCTTIDSSWFASARSGEKQIDILPSQTDQFRPWWLISSSGTTGKPKFMAVSQDVMLKRSLAVHEDFVRGQTRVCLLFPPNSRPFYVRAAAALLNGCPIVDGHHQDFLFAKKVDLVCGSPAQALSWLSEGPLRTKLPMIQVSGSRVRDADAALLLQSFDRVEDVYGSSETNKTFVNVLRREGGKISKFPKSLDSELEILSDDQDCVSPEEVGTIRIRNSYMVDGYIGDDKATERAFRNGWFYPGDRACWSANGALKIVGRTDETVSLGGHKVNLVEVDAVLRGTDGVRMAVAFPNPLPGNIDKLMAFLILDDINQRERVVSEAHKLCVEHLGIESTPSNILVLENLPLTHDGVPKRSECQRLASKLLAKDPNAKLN